MTIAIFGKADDVACTDGFTGVDQLGAFIL